MGAGTDLTPSMHWPAPVVSAKLADDAGPVLVTVEYRTDTTDRDEFLAALDRIAAERRRDGAYSWAVFEDVAQAGRFVETFRVESWLEHLRQHERVTNADRTHEERVRKVLRAEPVITHMIAAERGREPPAEG
jgi:quinol monooxygenase YgiN